MKQYQDLKKDLKQNLEKAPAPVAGQPVEEVRIPVLRLFEQLPDPREQYRQNDAPATRVIETI